MNTIKNNCEIVRKLNVRAKYNKQNKRNKLSRIFTFMPIQLQLHFEFKL